MQPQRQMASKETTKLPPVCSGGSLKNRQLKSFVEPDRTSVRRSSYRKELSAILTPAKELENYYKSLVTRTDDWLMLPFCKLTRSIFVTAQERDALTIKFNELVGGIKSLCRKLHAVENRIDHDLPLIIIDQVVDDKSRKNDLMPLVKRNRSLAEYNTSLQRQISILEGEKKVLKERVSRIEERPMSECLRLQLPIPNDLRSHVEMMQKYYALEEFQLRRRWMEEYRLAEERTRLEQWEADLRHREQRLERMNIFKVIRNSWHAVTSCCFPQIECSDSNRPQSTQDYSVIQS